MNPRSIEDVYSRETLLQNYHDGGYVSLYIYPNLHNKSEAQCKLWPWGDNDVSGRSLHCNRCITLVGDVYSGGAYACVGQGVYGKSLYLLLNISMKLRWV